MPKVARKPKNALKYALSKTSVTGTKNALLTDTFTAPDLHVQGFWLSHDRPSSTKIKPARMSWKGWAGLYLNFSFFYLGIGLRILWDHFHHLVEEPQLDYRWTALAELVTRPWKKLDKKLSVGLNTKHLNSENIPVPKHFDVQIWKVWNENGWTIDIA